MITRTITATTIESALITFKDNKPEVVSQKPITVNGSLTENEALRAVRKAYGQNAQVTALKEINEVFEISVEDFMKYAKKVEIKPEEQPKQEEVKKELVKDEDTKTLKLKEVTK